MDLITPQAEWRERAACLPFPAVLFFGLDDNESPIDRRNREEEAKSICADCAVRGQCLEFAISAKEPYGIWGGLTELERKGSVLARSN
jgi:WhiB family redox-sensing transcriptional regulator